MTNRWEEWVLYIGLAGWPLMVSALFLWLWWKWSKDERK